MLLTVTDEFEENQKKRPEREGEDQFRNPARKKLDQVFAPGQGHWKDEVEDSAGKQRQDQGFENFEILDAWFFCEVGRTTLAVNRGFRIQGTAFEAFHGKVSDHTGGKG